MNKTLTSAISKMETTHRVVLDLRSLITIGFVERTADLPTFARQTALSTTSVGSTAELRSASRTLTTQIFSADARAKLRAEHRALVVKRFDGGLSSREEHQLRYVEWQLDRVEDADHGAAVEVGVVAIERQAAAQHALSQEIVDFLTRSRALSRGNSGRRKRRQSG